MLRHTRTRFAGMLLVGALLALSAGPLQAAGRGTTNQTPVGPPQQSADLGAVLDANGTFRGDSRLTGTISTTGWTLAGAPAPGEAPRFVRANSANSNNLSSPASIGAWSALGTLGPSDGALGDQVFALAVSGTDVYVGGRFTNAAGIPAADYIARWNGTAWFALGASGSGDGVLNNVVAALAVSGTNLYVGGFFTDAAGIATADYIARWNGSAWSALSSNSFRGEINGGVVALAVSGSNIYAAGDFTDAAGHPTADAVAMWNGSAWSGLGSNGSGDGAIPGSIYALAVYGSNVFVGGGFSNAAGIPEADYVARWNGVNWFALGSNGQGVGALNETVNALAVSGTGDLYVGGVFHDAAGIPTADGIAEWSGGTTWSNLGSNGAGDGVLDFVNAIAISGNDVYVGGLFGDVGGDNAADNVVKWDGSVWSALGSDGSGDGAIPEQGNVSALAVSGADLYVGGYFANVVGAAEADYVTRWSGSAWFALGSNAGANNALNGIVYAIAVSGTDVYVGGDFTNAAGIPEADYLARWDGNAWSALGSDGSGDGALKSDVFALALSGGDLYVGGKFIDADGIPEADYLAEWDGANWSAVSPSGGALNSYVLALAVSGPDLYVGGAFTNASEMSLADRLAMWDGYSWSALGSNGHYGALGDNVYTLAFMGGDLYAGGLFVNAAGIPEADRVARWDGREWFALGSNGNGNGALNGAVTAIAPSDSGLYVGGYFTNASGIAQADYVASWDGSNWSALGSNGSGDGAINSAVESLVVDGADLYVGGEFSNASGVAVADHVARWSGSGWSGCGSNALGDGALRGPAYALGVSGMGLYAGGAFLNAAGIPEADYVARCALGTHVPDGRIRLGKGTFVGDNIYNATGANQTRTGSASRGNTVSFGISIQNDGSTADSYTVRPTGLASRAYTVRYFHGTVDITSAVVAGTYQTPSIAPSSTYLIRAQVTVTSEAAVGSKFKRLVTITSFGDTGQLDAVAFIAKRS